jgi:hypothetical protein
MLAQGREIVGSQQRQNLIVFRRTHAQPYQARVVDNPQHGDVLSALAFG